MRFNEEESLLERGGERNTRLVRKLLLSEPFSRHAVRCNRNKERNADGNGMCLLLGESLFLLSNGTRIARLTATVVMVNPTRVSVASWETNMADASGPPGSGTLRITARYNSRIVAKANVRSVIPSAGRVNNQRRRPSDGWEDGCWKVSSLSPQRDRGKNGEAPLLNGEGCCLSRLKNAEGSCFRRGVRISGASGSSLSKKSPSSRVGYFDETDMESEEADCRREFTNLVRCGVVA